MKSRTLEPELNDWISYIEDKAKSYGLSFPDVVFEKVNYREMNELAAYFSGVPRDPPAHRTKPENAAAAPRLTKKFFCTQCHGPKLLGQQHIPRLAGQQAEYLRTQLKLFKASRRADMDGNMTSAAQALNDQDIEVLVDYLAGLGAP